MGQAAQGNYEPGRASDALGRLDQASLVLLDESELTHPIDAALPRSNDGRLVYLPDCFEAVPKAMLHGS